jgi:phosphomannomutase / phosphoglucomutase
MSPAVAMVTASHNENGWTGVKMGCAGPLTFGPDEMARLKEIVLAGAWRLRDGGKLVHVDGMAERHIADVASGGRLEHRLKVVCACGNGTAGAFAPQLLEAIGCEVVALDCTSITHFRATIPTRKTSPCWRPSPRRCSKRRRHRARLRRRRRPLRGHRQRGPGDLCRQGRGAAGARPFGPVSDAAFVADVKSTALFATDPVLAGQWRQHELLEDRPLLHEAAHRELGALAGFEKSGHYFFRPPIGRGYDDGLLSAAVICRMLDRAAPRTMADLHANCPGPGVRRP